MVNGLENLVPVISASTGKLLWIPKELYAKVDQRSKEVAEKEFPGLCYVSRFFSVYGSKQEYNDASWED
jgi:hypothetical protein